MTNSRLSSINNISFSGRPNYKKVLPKIKNAVKRTFPVVESPSRLNPKTRVELNIYDELNDKLSCVRTIMKNYYKNGNSKEYFVNLIDLIKTFRVANCCEFAEISKTAMKMNGIKNCDIFCVYAQKTDGTLPPRSLDHTIAAINIKSSKNNKVRKGFFEPKPNTKIIDLWLDEKIETIKGLRKNSKKLEIFPDEKILLMPIQTIEPDNNTVKILKENFPTLVVR